MSSMMKLADLKVALYNILYELLPITYKDIQSLITWTKEIACVLSDLLKYLCAEVHTFCKERPLTFLPNNAVWIVAFLILFRIACYVEMTVVYICLCIFTAMVKNLGTRQEGELSAYSVFNRNFEQLLGTLTAEQLDAEIRHNLPQENGNIPLAAMQEGSEDENAEEEEEESKPGKHIIRSKKRELKVARIEELKSLNEKVNEADRVYIERLIARQRHLSSLQHIT